ncbi:MAG TPA: ferredoxin-type protein NapF [Rhodocyclaceae bacterium]|nr:ferredoxin-type protein NapF [Rhodocyclaceae bacterium]
MVDAGRRGFLGGRLRKEAPLRPPWALPEAIFSDRCSRCGDCTGTCPQGILKLDEGGYPIVDFSRGECTFCTACLGACRTGALVRGEMPWRLTPAVSQACLPRSGIECRSCEDACPASAIRFVPRLGGPALPAVDGERCTGCGACVAPCPAAAIALRA